MSTLAPQNERAQRARLECERLLALSGGGKAAHARWLARRAELVASGLMGADVVISPSA